MKKKTPEAGMEKPAEVPSLQCPAEVCGRVGNRETSRGWRPGPGSKTISPEGPRAQSTHPCAAQFSTCGWWQ